MPLGLQVAQCPAVADAVRRRTMVELPWRTLFKVIAAGALVWAWLQIWQLALLVVVAVLLAVALDPVVSWVQSRGLPRWGAATLVCVALLALIVGFLMLTWSSLADEAKFVGERLPALERSMAIGCRRRSGMPSE